MKINQNRKKQLIIKDSKSNSEQYDIDNTNLRKNIKLSLYPSLALWGVNYA